MEYMTWSTKELIKLDRPVGVSTVNCYMKVPFYFLLSGEQWLLEPESDGTENSGAQREELENSFRISLNSPSEAASFCHMTTNTVHFTSILLPHTANV